MRIKLIAIIGLLLWNGQNFAHSINCNKDLYKNQNLSFETRAKDLISKMTLDEKISQMVNDAAAIERLGIQEYNWWNECLHGLARAGKATVFPQSIGLGATFDPDLVYRMADAISDEARDMLQNVATEDSTPDLISTLPMLTYTETHVGEEVRKHMVRTRSSHHN